MLNDESMSAAVQISNLMVHHHGAAPRLKDPHQLSSYTSSFQATGNNCNAIHKTGRMTIVSPRSNNYERLEGGPGPTKSTVKRFGWLGWKRLAILVVGVLTLFWVFRPRQDHYYGPWTPSSNPRQSLTVLFSSLLPHIFFQNQQHRIR